VKVLTWPFALSTTMETEQVTCWSSACRCAGNMTMLFQKKAKDETGGR
jgi:hypothetical protein